MGLVSLVRCYYCLFWFPPVDEGSLRDRSYWCYRKEIPISRQQAKQNDIECPDFVDRAAICDEVIKGKSP
jgi:hypothetical protein